MRPAPFRSRPPGLRSARRATLLLLLATFACGLLWAPAALAQDPAAATSQAGAATSGDADAELSPMLTAIVAVSVAIERFWETVFGFLERLGLATSRLFGSGAALLAWAKTERERAAAVIESLVKEFGKDQTKPLTPDDQQKLAAAEQQLVDAQTRIEEALKSPQYLAFKSAATTGGSLVLGLLLNWKCDLHLFHAIGFPGVGDAADTVLTGLAIGAGPGPLHSLIKTLTELRGSLGAVADLARGNALKQAGIALKEAAAAATSNAAGGQDGARGLPPQGLEAVPIANAPAAPAPAKAPAVDLLSLQRQTARMLRPRP